MTDQDIIELLALQWSKSGVEQGDVLLVHSSLKRLLLKIKTDYGFIASPEIIYQSLKRSLGDAGTLILPLFNFDFPKSAFFDISNTPSHMGALTEIARLDRASARTGHPIYSFAVTGKHSDKFANVDNYSGYGNDSPFAVIQQLEGKIAVIGLTDQNSMTSYHFVEEQHQVPYRYFKEFAGTYIDKAGQSLKKVYALYVRDIEKGVQTDVNRMMDFLWKGGYYKGDAYDEGFGMRTIAFKDLYEQTSNVIQSGKAIDFLYSIKDTD